MGDKSDWVSEVLRVAVEGMVAKPMMDAVVALSSVVGINIQNKDPKELLTMLSGFIVEQNKQESTGKGTPIEPAILNGMGATMQNVSDGASVVPAAPAAGANNAKVTSQSPSRTPGK